MRAHYFYTDEEKEEVELKARSIGLGILKDDEYRLTKSGAKNKSPYYEDTMDCGTGIVFVLAQDDHVWISLIGENKWFKTSPIVAVGTDNGNILIETENSYYKLEEVKNELH